jgi:hypothetical protein
MLIKNTSALIKGLALGISFLVVLGITFSPVFEDGMNGLEYADNMFNKLSKGSSYFIPKVQKSAAKFNGREIAVLIKMSKPEETAIAQKLLGRTGVQVKDEKGSLLVSGDFGKMLAGALADADAAFKNDGTEFSTQYGLDAQAALNIWWNIMKSMDKDLKKDKKYEEARMVISVQKKAIEAAHNFYGIDAIKVADKAWIMSGLLVFYVVYTVWWGFAIFFLFEAIGFVMKKKAKVKKAA